MLNKKLRLLAAPATAIALCVSSLAVPAASAASVTVEAGQCTIALTEEDGKLVAQNYLKGVTGFSKAFRKVAVTQVPELAPIIEEYTGVEVYSEEWFEGVQLAKEKMIAAGFADELIGGIALFLFQDSEELAQDTSFGGWIGEETISQTDAQQLVENDSLGEMVVSAAVKAKVVEALKRDDLSGARAILEDELVAESMAEISDAKTQDFLKAVYDTMPNTMYDRELFALWLVQKCAAGESVDKPLFELAPQADGSLSDSLDFSDLSSGNEGSLFGLEGSDSLDLQLSKHSEGSSFGEGADGSEVGGILGLILGLGAIGALIAGIVTFLQQQGFIG